MEIKSYELIRTRYEKRKMEFENSVGLCLGNHYRLWDAKLVVQTAISSIYNVPMAEYPKVDEQRRALFRLYAREAYDVKADICGKKYPMTKDNNGMWTVTTDPLVVGFPLLLFHCRWGTGNRSTAARTGLGTPT